MDRKFWISSLAAFVILFAALFVLNVFILMDDWVASAGNILRYWDFDPNGGLSELDVYHFMVIPFMMWGLLMTHFYRRGMHDEPWLAQGARFGLLIALITIIPTRLFNYATFAFSDGSKYVPSPTVLKEMAWFTVALVVAGCVIAWLHRKPVG